MIDWICKRLFRAMLTDRFEKYMGDEKPKLSAVKCGFLAYATRDMNFQSPKTISTRKSTKRLVAQLSLYARFV